MTRNEALERAARIWGEDRLVSVQLRPDGGADVNLKPNHRIGRDVSASDTRERHYAYHRLDINGHIACHVDCNLLEKDAAK